jgi:hypothetical protein
LNEVQLQEDPIVLAREAERLTGEQPHLDGMSPTQMKAGLRGVQHWPASQGAPALQIQTPMTPNGAQPGAQRIFMVIRPQLAAAIIQEGDCKILQQIFYVFPRQAEVAASDAGKHGPKPPFPFLPGRPVSGQHPLHEFGIRKHELAPRMRGKTVERGSTGQRESSLPPAPRGPVIGSGPVDGLCHTASHPVTLRQYLSSSPVATGC